MAWGIIGRMGEAFLLSLVSAVFGLVFVNYRETLKKTESAHFQNLVDRVESRGGIGTQYFALLSNLLDRVDFIFEKHKRSDTPNYIKRASPFSTNAFDMCLTLALVYPVMSAFIIWVVTGDAGEIASTINLHRAANWEARVGVIVVFSLLVYFFIKSTRSRFGEDIKETEFRIRAVIGEYIFIVALIPVFVVLFNQTMDRQVIDGLGLLSFLVIIAMLSAMNLRFPRPHTSIGFLAGVLFVGLVCNNFSEIAFVIYIVAIVPVGLWVATFSQIKVTNPALHQKGLFIFGVLLFILTFVFVSFGWLSKWTSAVTFVIIFPLINATFDWLSIGLTRLLLRKSLKAKSHLLKMVYWLADLLGAFIIMTLLCASLVIALSLMNFLTGNSDAVGQFIPIGAELESIQSQPFNLKYYWLYFCIFSTMIPTVIHTVVWIFSLWSVPLSGSVLIKQMVATASGSMEPFDLSRVALILTLQWCLSIVILLVLTVGVYHLFPASKLIFEFFFYVISNTYDLSLAVLSH